MMVPRGILVLFSLVTLASAKLPPSWKVCKRNDPGTNECLKLAVTGAIRELKAGNQQLGVPSLDPLHIDAVSIQQGSSAVNLKLDFRNLNMIGLTTAVIDKINADWKNNKIMMEFHTTAPLRLEGDYTSKGRILVLPIGGVGRSFLVLDNFRSKVLINLKRVKKNGKEHAEVSKLDISIDTTRLHLDFQRKNQETISQSLNMFLNQNWRELLQELKPAVSKSFSTAIGDYANSIFSKVPLDDITLP